MKLLFIFRSVIIYIWLICLQKYLNYCTSLTVANLFKVENTHNELNLKFMFQTSHNLSVYCLINYVYSRYIKNKHGQFICVYTMHVHICMYIYFDVKCHCQKKKAHSIMTIIAFINHAFNKYCSVISLCQLFAGHCVEKRFMRHLTVKYITKPTAVTSTV